MAKLRSVSTAFWSDPFIEDLTPNHKLLFLYLVTNEKTNMLGIYESSIKKISFETGLKKDDVLKGLKEFERVNKVKYINNYVILINFMKHQKFNTNMKKSAIDIYNNLPKELKDSTITVCKSNPSKGFESLLKCFGMVSKIEIEDEIETKEEVKKEDKDILSDFKKSLQPFLDKYGKEMLNDFYLYWTEKGEREKKYRWQKQKTWDLSRRLQRWDKNNYNSTKKDPKQMTIAEKKASLPKLVF